MTFALHVPMWLLYAAGAVVGLFVLLSAVFGLFAFRALNNWTWR